MNSKNIKIWEPFRDLVMVRDDVDRLLDTFFEREGGAYDECWRPAVDIEENNGNLVVKAELPGISKQDIKVSVKDDVLTILGERKRESEQKDRLFHRVERCYGQFRRMIRLPAQVDADKVKAAYKDGVLQITLPKPESLKPRQIEVDVN